MLLFYFVVLPKKRNCPTVLISVHLFVFLFISSCLSHYFLPVLYLCWDDDSFSFSSFLPLLLVSHTIPACSFPKTVELEVATMEVLTLLTSALLCVVCCFSPLSLSSTHTLLNLDTGQVGGVYHSMMSLMDSVLSVMDSWDCRKKDECCAQCSCLVCRNPQLF